jgi:tetratricopeptide (TPR) repeat protein
MKINRNIFIVILGIILWLPSGCSEEFLIQENTREATDESLFDEPDHAVQLISGVYNTFHNNDFIIKALWYQANFLTQDYKNWGSDTFFATYEIPTNFGALNTFWERSYQGIARVNSALEIIPKMRDKGVIDQALADRLMGEAFFLRGIFHYYLATEFGGVPIVMEISTDDGRNPRNTQDEAFNAVALDMQAAIDLLPWEEDYGMENIGRASKGAALAYLGDAQMWLGQYDDAVTSYNQLEGHYNLEQNFMDIQDYYNQNGSEAIFSVQYSESSTMRNWVSDTHWLETFTGPEEITGTGYAYVDKKYYDSFEEGDERKFATVIGPGDEHPDPKINISDYANVEANYGGMNTLGTIENPWTGNDGQRSGYYDLKTWRDPFVTGNYGDNVMSDRNLIFMRYGQVLLSKAEALFRSGHEGEARGIINNQIRSRAGLEPSNEGDFLTLLANEYRAELGGEFSLFFYLRRGGIAEEFVMKNYGITIPQGHTLMPIPVAQIATNEELVQNPGY